MRKNGLFCHIFVEQRIRKCSSRISRQFCLMAKCNYRLVYRNAEARDTGSGRQVSFCTSGSPKPEVGMDVHKLIQDKLFYMYTPLAI